MATKTHSYGLRARANLSNGTKSETSSSRPVESVPVPPPAAAETPSIKVNNEPRSSKRTSSAKRRKGSTMDNDPAFSVKCSKKRVISSKIMTSTTTKTTTTRRPNNLSDDIEDFQPAMYTFEAEEAASIRSSLLNWYDNNHRILPWRHNPHSRHQLSTDDKGLSKGKNRLPGNRELSPQQQRAYEVWISEIMLQQTRVDTVLLYYQKWMEKWPTLQHLAGASLEDVYCLWAGLGYYRRARFLLEGAKQIVEKCAGVFPETVAELRNVRGIGQYTAGAIASIAFNRPVPLVDGNVVRVLCRLRAISESPKDTKTVKLLWALAEELVDAKRPGDLNQALMELGATLCTMNPDCSSCPIASHCKALSLASLNLDDYPQAVKSVKEFPVKVAKVPPRDEYVSVCVLEVGPSSKSNNRNSPSEILLMQRPQKGLLAGLWEFPSVSLGNLPVSAAKQKSSMDHYLKKQLNLDVGARGLVQRREHLGTLRHLFSHIRWHLSIEWLLLSPSGGLQNRIIEFRKNGDPVKWVANDSVQELGLTTSVRKIYEMYLKHLKEHGKEEVD
ncbi:unnamed protein product [Calypogeia fissa]